jgi:regulator of replication initiation timing
MCLNVSVPISRKATIFAAQAVNPAWKGGLYGLETKDRLSEVLEEAFHLCRHHFYSNTISIEAKIDSLKSLRPAFGIL